MYNEEMIEKAKIYLSNKGYGSGINYTTNLVASLMAEYAEDTKIHIDISSKEDSPKIAEETLRDKFAMYALITKHRTPRIIIMSETLGELDDAIETLYWNKKGLTSKGSNYSMEDLMKDYRKVKLYFDYL